MFPAPRHVVRPRRLAVVALIAAAAVAATGCEERRRMPDHVAVRLNDVTMRHPIDFEREGQRLHVEAPPRGAGLSHNQYVDVYRFLRRFKAESDGTLEIASATDRDTRLVLRDIGTAMREAGVDVRKVRRGRYRPQPYSTEVVRVSYARPKAIAPHCGNWPRDVGREPERVPYPDFGCATQRNLAGMVANARDLQRPQEEQPASAERRTAVWSKYIAPEARDAGPADTKVKTVDTTKKQ